MDRAKYSSCIGTGMKGKKFTTEERRTEFCILSKICSGKAANREEAAIICSQPKAPKPVTGEKHHRRSRKTQECPAFDAMSLMPECERRMGNLRGKEIPANADIKGFCELILG